MIIRNKYSTIITGFFEFGIAAVLFINFSLITYGFSQLKGQLNILLNTKPIEKVLMDPEFPDSLKTKLILIQEIRAFSVDSIGINPSQNYTTVYDQKGKDLLWVLTTCEPFELKPYEWKFPFLGTVTYKGFFDLEKGREEARALLEKGYDGGLSTVGAWSTLGWFKDPVLSNMLTYEEGDLANLIIHELTHGTLFVKGDVEFNENLASFIGDQGALRFLRYKYGEASPEMMEYVEGRQDEKIFFDYIITSAKRLDSLYSSMNDEPVEAKEKMKSEMFEEIIHGVDKLDLNKKDRYQKSVKKIRSHKNAYFMAFIRYGAKQDDFEREFTQDFNEDLKAYMEYLKKKYPSI